MLKKNRWLRKSSVFDASQFAIKKGLKGTDKSSEVDTHQLPSCTIKVVFANVRSTSKPRPPVPRLHAHYLIPGSVLTCTLSAINVPGSSEIRARSGSALMGLG